MSTDMASFSPNKPTNTDDTEIRLTVSTYQGQFPLLPLLTQYLHFTLFCNTKKLFVLISR